MQMYGYRHLASLYDVFTSNKDYELEVEFLQNVFEGRGIESILDVACGTGTHMQLLEKEGYRCDGLDLSGDMLNVAREKVEGELFHADMANFYLDREYDAVICLYASFNHLVDVERAQEALNIFAEHLREGGTVLIDLHCPMEGGEKTESFGNVTRKMKWIYDEESGIEETEVLFLVGEREVHDHQTLRIYSPDEVEDMLREEGFTEILKYGDYSLTEAKDTSKNVQVVARKM